MTATAPAPSATGAPPTAPRASRLVELRWVARSEWWLLGAIAVIGAVARAGGFSNGTLYRDDAWVALTTRVSLGTAARMVVTTPGFVLAERVWIGWFPHVLAVDQLPTFLASVAGIVAVGRLARWWGLSAPASLVAAGLVAASYSDIQYATRIKPYAFDLLGACLVLWLAERIRRDGGRVAPWLAAASVFVCAFSLTPVPLVLGVWAAVVTDAVVRRRLTVRLVVSGAATAIGLGALWLAVRGDVSPRLRHSWDGYYLVVTSAHGLARSARTIVDGFVRGLGVTTPQLGLPGLGTLDRVAIIALFVVGIAAWRRQLLCLAAVGAALVLSIPSLVPLGTGRTDAYLYPAVAMVVAEGATRAWHLARRLDPSVAVVVLAGSVAVAGLLAGDRVAYRPTYPGGNFAVVTGSVKQALKYNELVIIGGTARWPWAYYDVTHVHIAFSHLYNNGYTTLSDNPHVIVIPGTPIEGGYVASASSAARRAKEYCGGVLYIETDDWPTMPMTLLRALQTTGGLSVTSGPSDIHGYRVWTLASSAPCPPAPSKGT